jgi:hypothetical protein
MGNRLKALAVSAVAIAGIAGVVAAQDRTTSPAAEKLMQKLKERAETRPAARATAIGKPAKEVVKGEVSWVAMKTELALTARRDSVAKPNMAAQTARPPGVRAMAPERLKNVVVKEVNVTQLPVLAPSNERIQQTLKIYSLGDSYSATAEVEDGVAMRMSGARRKIVVGDARAARAKIASMKADGRVLPGLEVPYIISRSDSSTDLSFSKFGAGYVLALMCDDPEGDVRCTGDEFIVGLASNLIVLNSTAGGGE